MTEQHELGHALTIKILLGLVLGIVLGVIINLFFGDNAVVQTHVVDGVFQVAGKWFVNGLKMLVVPLVLVSIICGASSLSDPAKLGRVGGKALALYLLTTCIAISLALTGAILVKPGEGANPTPVEKTVNEPGSVYDVLINIIPSNMVDAMAQDKMLQLIVIALLVGIALTRTAGAGSRVREFFEDLNAVIMAMVIMIMKLAPYGVFALMVQLAATSDIDTFLGVGKYMLLVIAVLMIHLFVTYPTLLKLFTGLNPVRFLAQMRDTMLFAFTTASSNATMPVTMRTVNKRMGVSKEISSFTIPLGATINMDGTAIMQGIAAGFIAQYYGVDLTAGQYLMIILMVVMASIGAAGVPSVGLVLLSGVLAQVGLPAEGIALIFGVDRILDMTRTAVNVTGDATVATIVAKSEGELDYSVFEAEEDLLDDSNNTSNATSTS